MKLMTEGNDLNPTNQSQFALTEILMTFLEKNRDDRPDISILIVLTQRRCHKSKVIVNRYNILELYLIVALINIHGLIGRGRLLKGR